MEFESKNRKHDRRYFYKYTSAGTAIKILINKTLRGSSPLFLNDPFDVARELTFPFTEKEMAEAIIRELARLIEEDVDVNIIGNQKMRDRLILAKSSYPSEKQSADFASRLRNREASEASSQPMPLPDELKKKWDELVRRTRILSLSEVYDSDVMWAHYADNYRGVVLELECLDIYNYKSGLLEAEKVVYSDAPLKLGGSLDYWVKMHFNPQFSQEDYNVLFKPLELTKKLIWSIEREWRVVFLEKDSDEQFTDYHVPSRTFSKIFLGRNVLPDARATIKNLLDFDLSHIELYDMEIDHGSRAIKFNRA